MTFCATSAASSGRARSASTIANSSPLMRATVSPLRTVGLQAQRDLLQQLVAAGVAERVVDQLEVVEVDEQHRERRVAALRLHDHLREAVGEQRAVGQPGQRVELRQVGEPALAVDALQRGRQHARRGLDEIQLLGAERVGLPVADAQQAAHVLVAAHRDQRRAAQRAPTGTAARRPR